MADFIDYKAIDFITGIKGIDYEYYFSILFSLKHHRMIKGKEIPLIGVSKYESFLNIEQSLNRKPEDPFMFIDVVYFLSGIKYEELEQLTITELFPVFNSILAEYKNIIERESSILRHDPEPEELESGIEEMSKFGRFSTIDALAGGDVLKHEMVVALPYNQIFTKLYHDSERSRIQRNYQKIKNRRNDTG